MTQGRPFDGIFTDLTNRLDVYVDDYRDGLRDKRARAKLLSSVIFLYFACLLPTIAFGTLHHTITVGQLGVQKAIVAQALGGVLYGLFGGQPLVILQTTAPLALYVELIYNSAKNLGVGFLPFYAAVGLWNALLLMLYAVFGACKLMRWSTR